MNGISNEQLLSLTDYAQSPAFDERERLVLDLAVAMAQLPADISEELGRRLRNELDEAELVELAGAIAWENQRARFNRVFGVAPAASRKVHAVRCPNAGTCVR